MNLTIDRESFLKALLRVAGVAGKRQTMPILSCVLLTAKGGVLALAASDLEISVQVVTAAGLTIQEPGRIAVPAGKLKDIISSVSADTVTLCLRDNLRLEIAAGDSLFKLAGLDPKDFPNVAGSREGETFSMHADDLQAFISACLHAVCTDDIAKPRMCGMRLCAENGMLIAVATDGHRMSLAGKRFPVLPAVGAGITIPMKGLAELRKLAPEPAEFRLGKNKIEVTQGETFLSIRLLEGDFPDYRRAAPGGYESWITVRSAELSAAVTRVKLLSTKSIITLEILDGAIFLRAQNDTDEALDTVKCELHGAPLTVQLKAGDVLDALASLDGGETVIKYRDNLSPLVILPANFGAWDERLLVLTAMRA